MSNLDILYCKLAMCTTLLTERLRLQPVDLSNINDFLEFSSDSEKSFICNDIKPIPQKKHKWFWRMSV